MTIYELILQCQGNEGLFYLFILLPMSVGLPIGLFNISVFPTFQSGVLRLFYPQRGTHLFFHCQLQLPCYDRRNIVTVTCSISFSVFYFCYSLKK